DAKQATLKDDPKHGISYKDLRAVKANINHPCRGVFEVQGVKQKNGDPICSHGPDRGPDDVDMTDPSTTENHMQKIQAWQDSHPTISLDELARHSGNYLDDLAIQNSANDFFNGINPYPSVALACNVKITDLTHIVRPIYVATSHTTTPLTTIA